MTIYEQAGKTYDAIVWASEFKRQYCYHKMKIYSKDKYVFLEMEFKFNNDNYCFKKIYEAGQRECDELFEFQENMLSEIKGKQYDKSA